MPGRGQMRDSRQAVEMPTAYLGSMVVPSHCQTLDRTPLLTKHSRLCLRGVIVCHVFQALKIQEVPAQVRQTQVLVGIQ